SRRSPSTGSRRCGVTSKRAAHALSLALSRKRERGPDFGHSFSLSRLRERGPDFGHSFSLSRLRERVGERARLTVAVLAVGLWASGCGTAAQVGPGTTAAPIAAVALPKVDATAQAE